MSSTSRTTGAVVGFVGLAAAITGGILAIGSDEPAGAAELERFSSCAELESWVETTSTPDFSVTIEDGGVVAGPPLPATGGAATGLDAPATSAADPASGSGAARESADSSTGGTNTVVAGVDEIDVVDRVGDDRVLVSRNGVLSLVDLGDRSVVTRLTGLPFDARVSVLDGIVWAAGTSDDGTGVRVVRARVDGDSLTTDGEWTTEGYLLDARRIGGRLHVVAVDHPGEGGVVPFEGGAVPCDQVWRPADPSTTAAATLVASLPDEGVVAPVAAAEVVGAAGNLLVTDASVFVATETWGDGTRSEVTTGLHRFTLDGLVPVGSGSVPGTLAGPFALDEHEGRLRVATSAQPQFGIFPMPVEPPVGIGVDPATGAVGDAVGDAVGVPAPQPVPSPTLVQPTFPEGGEPLAEVFVLDTEGDLDVLGSTGRFGRDGETIHGVRFTGDVAYVVTFRQTDPFWVVDLRDPAAPAVVGELEIPGFSAYLHPLTDDRVVGFGPDGNGGVAARLFDVGDPTAPSVLDEIRLGDDSPVTWDHHAFAGLDDGRFAVPVNSYPRFVEERCAAPEIAVPDLPAPVVPAPVPVEPIPVEQVPTEPGQTEPGSPPAPPTLPEPPVVTLPEPVSPVPPICEPIFTGGETGMVVLGLTDGQLAEVERAIIETDGSFSTERGLLGPDGTWFLVGYDRLQPTDGGAAVVL